MENKKLIFDNMTIENISVVDCNIYPEEKEKDFDGFQGDILVVDFGRKTKNDSVVAQFKLNTDKYKITKTGASCGCTEPSFQKLGDGEYVITIEFDKSRVMENVSKWAYLYDGAKQMKINVLINKK